MSAQDPSDRSLVGLLSGLPTQIIALIQAEIARLKIELGRKVKAVAIGAALLVVALVFLYFGVEVLIAAAVLGVATALPPWLAALLVGVFFLIITIVLALVGVRAIMKGAKPPLPEETIAGVKEDVRAVKGIQDYDH